MYRAAARHSDEQEHAAIDALSQWAQRTRAAMLVICVALGVMGGFVALHHLSVWIHVFMLLYGCAGFGAGFILYHGVGRPLLALLLRARARRLAERVGAETAAIEASARAYLV